LAPGREGRPYAVVPGESLLTILALRGGALAKAGHNHVIAAHDVTGTVYVPGDVLHSSFDLRFAVAQLTIDEPQLRAQEGPDFPPDVPEAAREGTRRNMLGEALLDAAQFSEITLASERIEAGDGASQAPANGGAGGQDPDSARTDATHVQANVQAHVQVTVRGQAHSLVVPVRYQLQGDSVVADGEVPIRQSELGLTPFSAALGALQVQDELHVKFHIVARVAAVRGKNGN
jgi:YceI-like domain